MKRLLTAYPLVPVALMMVICVAVWLHIGKGCDTTVTDNQSAVGRTQVFFMETKSRLISSLKAPLHLEGSEEATRDAFGVLMAMTLGSKQSLSSDIRNVYAATGTSHVLAISGLHLSIIYMLLSMLTLSRLWHRISQILIIIAIWAFAFLVGLPPSVVRASTMLTVCAILSLGHRRAVTLNTLSLALIIILAVSPKSILDIGLQLSFASVISIVILVPLMERLMPMEWLGVHRVSRMLFQTMAVSLAAFIGTAPLVAFYFHRLPLLFLITNLFTLPIVTILLYGMLAALLFPPLLPALLFLASLLNRLLKAFALLPFSSIPNIHPTLWHVAVSYLVIVFVVIVLHRLRREEFSPFIYYDRQYKKTYDFAHQMTKNEKK